MTEQKSPIVGELPEFQTSRLSEERLLDDTLKQLQSFISEKDTQGHTEAAKLLKNENKAHDQVEIMRSIDSEKEAQFQKAAIDVRGQSGSNSHDQRDMTGQNVGAAGNLENKRDTVDLESHLTTEEEENAHIKDIAPQNERGGNFQERLDEARTVNDKEL